MYKKLAQHLDQITNQKVIVRCNFDIPIEDGKVQDTTRIEAAIPTIKALRKNNNQLLLIAHYDRPDGKFDSTKSLRPVVPVLEPLINEQIEFVEYLEDFSKLTIPFQKPISFLDNLRFWSQEEENSPEFALSLSSFAQHYVNEAFANCHRDHASIVGIPKHLPSYAGLSLSEEIDILTKIKDHPEKPLVLVLGGAKLKTKEPLIEAFKDKADSILVGGKIAQDLKDSTDLPSNVQVASLSPGEKDITPEAAKKFAQIIQSAKTVIWNGSLGVFEEEEYRQGTTIVAQAVNTTPAFTLVGGGDTETALTVLDKEHGIDFISTGGGAMLTFLSKGSLTGLQALS